MFSIKKFFGKNKHKNVQEQPLRETAKNAGRNFLLFAPAIRELKDIQEIVVYPSGISVQVTEQEEDTIQISLEGTILEGTVTPLIETEQKENVLEINATANKQEPGKIRLERVKLELPKRLMDKVRTGE